jgi:hypothetical protein
VSQSVIGIGSILRKAELAIAADYELLIVGLVMFSQARILSCRARPQAAFAGTRKLATTVRTRFATFMLSY